MALDALIAGVDAAVFCGVNASVNGAGAGVNGAGAAQASKPVKVVDPALRRSARKVRYGPCGAPGHSYYC